MAIDVSSAVDTVTGGIKSAVPLGVGVFAWLGIVLVFGIIAGVISWLVLRKKKFKNKIVVWKKIGGRFKPALKDRAMEVKHGIDGTTILYLAKLKKIIPMPSLQVDDNTFYFFERADGEWINFDVADFDEESRKLGAHFLDKEMRHVRLALERNMAERLEKKASWLSQHWTVVAGVAFITMIGIMVFLLFDKWIELAAVTNAGVETAKEVMDRANTILGSLDNICTGGSGIQPA